MKKINSLLLALVASVLVSSCGTTRTVPITGRKQNLMVGDAEMLSLSTQEYSKYMATAKKSTDTKNTAMVQRVGKNLANAVETYLKNNGLASELEGYQWEFNLVQDNNVNAFCMPGGKIVVYEGLLPVTKDEASLAIVLGHEIAHAVAKHSAEQYSNKLKQQGFLQGASILAAGMGVSSDVQQLGTLGIGVISPFFTSGFSRKHENEADHIGLIFAAMAGYDPAVAVDFWQRMSAATGGGSNSLLSDHPSDATRIKNIQGWLPEAQKYYVKPAATTTKTKTTQKTSSKKTTTKNKKK